MKLRARNGFTLLELLLAVSLLSLITASIMGGIHLGRRSWEASRASEALDDVETALRATTGLIARSFLVSPDQAAQNGQPAPVFIGDVRSCRFVALSEGGAQWGGLIVTEVGAAGDALAVWTKPYRPLEGLSLAREAMKRTIVAEDLVAVQFSYFGAQTQGQAPAWTDNWRSTTNIPALVLVKITLRRLGRDMEAAATVALRQQ